MSKTPQIPSLATFRRIVVKVGSSLLVDSGAGALKRGWLASLAADIASLHKEKRDVLVVSSGAIALARRSLGLHQRRLRLEEQQAAAAVGQIRLAQAWSEALSARGLTAAQLLLTLDDDTLAGFESTADHPHGADSLADLDRPSCDVIVRTKDHHFVTALKFTHRGLRHK